jgi:hypothetical protein
MLLIAPVAIILVAENLGHIKAVTAMTGRNLDQYMGRAFIGDGVATVVSGGAGGTGVTTYAENIGVMAATKIYSTAVFVVAALIAVVLGFSPKFGALIQAIPLPVMGGVSIVVFGLIAVAGAKIWVDNKVDFSENKNLIVAAITLVLGTGDFTLRSAASRWAASAPRPSARSCCTRCSEVIADGNVHVYAPLRGKAIAGARGNTEARIFSTCMEAQLVAIAGIYRTNEVPLPDAVLGKSAQVRLDGKKIAIDAIP